MKTKEVENFGLGLRHASMSPMQSSQELNTYRIDDDHIASNIIRELSNRIESDHDVIFAAKLFGESVTINKKSLDGVLFHGLVKDAQLKEQDLILGIIHYSKGKNKLKSAYRISKNRIISLKPSEFKEMKSVLSAIFI